ncbi:DUF2946 family protein [Bordetella trematum]|uniref:DUF2946 family protein n=1 Tax=Bordetella trematum TaxID=123899 RepID=UPI000D9FB1DD|nr:DUF2946 family protein [Bordetella trematum]SPU53328.1 Uncharacterised protein [Bordetella trematum]VDH09062.1 Uncharacterised protein [Bordetella trematum]
MLASVDIQTAQWTAARLRRPSRLARGWLLGWLLLMVACRAMVPAGYMPQASSERQVALTFCSPDSALSTILVAAGSPGDHPESGADALACAFCLLSQQAACLPHRGDIAFFAPLAQAPPGLAPLPLPAPTATIGGPPLGPRAPPLA